MLDATIAPSPGLSYRDRNLWEPPAVKSKIASPVTVIAVSLLLAAPSAHAERLIKEFKGTQSTVTQEFIVEAPWIIDWRLDSEYEHRIALDIVLIDATTGAFIGGVKSGTRNNVTRRSNGVRMFDMDGRFKLRISSSFARWTIKVKQLTEEEAAGYTPVRPPE